MNIHRRTFLKTGGCLLASLLSGSRVPSLRADHSPGTLFGRETAGRCPLCALGCGIIYRSRGRDRWSVEGDPDCPVAGGGLCARGNALAQSAGRGGSKGKPLYRAPGSGSWQEIEWKEAVHLVSRRFKDLRDRDLGYTGTGGGEDSLNRFDGLGVVAGGSLTNEEAYTISRLFRALGVTNLDTTVRSSHGMALLGLMDSLGLPGATHPPSQLAHSDVVVLVGCNPGQTAPPLARALDEVRRRRGTVIVIDPRRSETLKHGDLWLQARPGTDGAVLGAMINWILAGADLDRKNLIDHTDAAFITLSEIMGEYEKHTSGKYRNWNVVDETLEEPWSVFNRMKGHFERYDLRKVSNLSGVKLELLRRACTLLARTTSAHFSAAFVFGSGALASPSGADRVRMAVAAQALLGNLDKKGGGIILPAAAGNAQGVCDMGLLSPYLPGYVPLPHDGDPATGEDAAALDALLRSWYPGQAVERSRRYLPRLEPGEAPCLSTIFQGIEDERVRALVTFAADPAGSLSESATVMTTLANLELLVVMDTAPGRTGGFWRSVAGRENTIRTEVLFIPTGQPACKNGSMTDGGRRARRVAPPPGEDDGSPTLLEFLVQVGTSLRVKYRNEGGGLPEPVTDLDWPLFQSLEDVAGRINGMRASSGGDVLLPPGNDWQAGDRCGNRLYRGWMDADGWKVSDRDPSDPFAIGLHEGWGWSWPGGVADPFSWAGLVKEGRGNFLRWQGQDAGNLSARDVLPIRPLLPVKFWKHVRSGSPFPEHYEPFHSPLPDFLTGGRSNPNMLPRHEGSDKWGYLSRRPEDILSAYPVIVSVHRTGNIMGTGGVTSGWDVLTELGTCRIVEVGLRLAGELGIQTGDRVRIVSPNDDEGIPAGAHVTGRVDSFESNGTRYDVVSVTLYGEDAAGINTLTPSAFDLVSGGMELKVFMGRIEKVQG